VFIPTRTAAAIAGLGLALSLSACSSSESVSDANAAYCEGATATQEQFQKLEDLIDSGAPTEAIKEQRDLTQAAIQANSVPLSQLQDSVKTEIEAANDAFNEAISAIPDDASPADAAASYKAAIDARSAAVAELESELGCS
jgi:hypothetical protein